MQMKIEAILTIKISLFDSCPVIEVYWWFSIDFIGVEFLFDSFFWTDLSNSPSIVLLSAFSQLIPRIFVCRVFIEIGSIWRWSFSQLTVSINFCKYEQLNGLFFISNNTNCGKMPFRNPFNSFSWFSPKKSDRKSCIIGKNILKSNSFILVSLKSRDTSLCWCESVPNWMTDIFVCFKFKYSKFCK